VDETSTRKGHNYFTIMCDRVAKKVVGIGVGKVKESFAHALIDMEIRGGSREKIRSITMDMSKSYISAASEMMRQADIIFDRFHLVKKLNEAVDKIRRQEQKEYNELLKTRYLWLRNNSNLSEEQRLKVNYLGSAYPNIGTAYRLKELLKIVLDEAYHSHYLAPLNEWMKQAWERKLEPIQEFVNMLKRHWYGIKTYFKRIATNAFAERVNLKIQEIKRIAKGYRNTHNFIIMIYFHLGGLKFNTHFK
jgi:transposase